MMEAVDRTRVAAAAGAAACIEAGVGTVLTDITAECCAGRVDVTRAEERAANSKIGRKIAPNGDRMP